MAVLCITLPETPERADLARQHFADRGLFAVVFIPGINGHSFGLSTRHCYEVDHPGSGYVVDPKHVGLHLSHYMAWAIALAIGDEVTMILEDDAMFQEDWSSRMPEMPPECDMMLIGSCNCSDKPRELIAPNVYHVKWPQCTHAYLVRRRALNVLLATQRKCWAPIDLSLVFNSYPQLVVYTVLPRIVDQRNTVIGA